MRSFKPYKPRNITFEEQIDVNDWRVKFYTITEQHEFNRPDIIEAIKRLLPDWIDKANSQEQENYQVGTLIVHEGRAGFWALFNWWMGEDILRTQLYYTLKGQTINLKRAPYGTDGMLCIWEMEVQWHERAAWIKHILNNSNSPDFNGYLKDTLSTSPVSTFE